MSDAEGPAPDPFGDWIHQLTGSGGRESACSAALVAHHVELLGQGPVDWAIDLGRRMTAEISDQVPGFGGDEESLQTLGMGTEATALQALAVLTSATPESIEISEESLRGDRVFARQGIPLDLVLRGIRIGHSIMVDALLDELAGLVDEPLRSAETRRTSTLLFAYIDRFSSDMAREYVTEHDRWVMSASAERAEMVRRILDGEAVSADGATRTLAYPVARHHVAMVLWHDQPTAESGSALQRTAAEVLAGSGCSASLLVPHGTASVWVWASWKSEPATRPRLDRPGSPGVRVAVGMPGAGFDGFRESHRQAQKAADLVRSTSATRSAQAPGVTWYTDVELVVLLSQDMELARSLVRRELGAMAADDAATAELRETVAAYLEQERSLAKAAAILHVARNTVAYRTKKFEDATGRDLRERRLELEAALRLVAHLGRAVLVSEG